MVRVQEYEKRMWRESTGGLYHIGHRGRLKEAVHVRNRVQRLTRISAQ